MNAKLSIVYTPKQIAETTQTSEEVVIAELESGNMHGFKIGNEWRVSETQLIEFMKGEKMHNSNTGLMIPDLCATEIDWEKVEPFTYAWPDRSEETYSEVYQATINISSGRHIIKIGYTTRKAAGMKDRVRVIVFMTVGNQLFPVVEFAGANDFDKTQKIVSFIKNREGRHVQSKEQLPHEYDDMPTCIYSDIVNGPYASNGLAVVTNKSDMATMVRHALIRALPKGWIEF